MNSIKIITMSKSIKGLTTEIIIKMKVCQMIKWRPVLTALHNYEGFSLMWKIVTE